MLTDTEDKEACTFIDSTSVLTNYCGGAYTHPNNFTFRQCRIYSPYINNKIFVVSMVLKSCFNGKGLILYSMRRVYMRWLIFTFRKL
jgi:hypothetical protein